MAFSQSLADRIRLILGNQPGTEVKRMFGGLGILLGGNLLVGVWKTALIARIGPDAYKLALQQPHVREFDITGRAMKGWVLVEPDGIENDEQLRDWIEKSLDFVATLPKK